MTQKIIIDIPDDAYQQLLSRAQQAGQSPEALVKAWLLSSLQPIAHDPLIRLSGSIASSVTDLAERHDHYLGQGLYEEMRGQQNG